MRDGTGANSLNPWNVAMFRTLKTVQPQSDTEQSAYDHWVDQTSDREQARQDRVHSASGVIPPSLWIVLLFISAIVFAYMLFFADSAEPKRSQAMLIGSATTIVVVTLLAIHALDKPYHPGLGSIHPVAMERSLRLLDEARGAVSDATEPPCNAEGVAG